MIIWSEKQYQAFLRKSGMSEPTSEKASTPVSPASPIIYNEPVKSKPVNVGRDMNWLPKTVFIICLTVIAVIGMVHEKPSDAKPVAPIVKTHIAHIHHHKKSHKKVLTTAKPACKCNCIENAKPISVEQVEERFN
jgi:hypothetical protein